MKITITFDDKLVRDPVAVKLYIFQQVALAVGFGNFLFDVENEENV